MIRFVDLEKGEFMHTRTNRPATVIALLAASAAVLAGCTHFGRSGASPRPSPSVPKGGLPVGVVNATGVPSAVPNNTASRKNVTISACKATKDGWQATGTATNPGDTQTSYTVTIFFATSGGTVIGTGQSSVTVKPAGQESWTVSSTFHAPPDTRCVLRGVG